MLEAEKERRNGEQKNELADFPVESNHSGVRFCEQQRRQCTTGYNF